VLGVASFLAIYIRGRGSDASIPDRSSTVNFIRNAVHQIACPFLETGIQELRESETI
jgi:hypothetical protein